MEKKWVEMTEQYHLMKAEIHELQVHKNQSVTKQEHQRILVGYEKVQTELEETKAAMMSYKNMCEVTADQTKSLKLMIERKKDENENLVTAVRE